MARQESRDIAVAFRDGVPCTRARTKTDGQSVWLHGNRIAWRDENDGTIWLCLRGWATMLTRERLNAICQAFAMPVGFYQWKGETYFGGHDRDCNTSWHAGARVIDPNEHIALAGPLGMLAINAALRAAA